MEFLNLFRKKVTKQTIDKPVFVPRPPTPIDFGVLIEQAEKEALHEIVQSKLELELTHLCYTPEEIEQTAQAQELFEEAILEIQENPHKNAIAVQAARQDIREDLPMAVWVSETQGCVAGHFGLTYRHDDVMSALANAIIN